MLPEKRQECQERQKTNDDKGFSHDVSPDVFLEDQETSTKRQQENPHEYSNNDIPDVPDVSSEGTREKHNLSNYEIEKITYATGEDVYQVITTNMDGKSIIRIVNPDCPEFEDIQREYEQRSR